MVRRADTSLDEALHGSASSGPVELHYEVRGRGPAGGAAVPYLYGERTRRRHAGRIGEDIARRLEPAAPSLTTHVQQLVAAGSHRTQHRLDEIVAPTLVVHGAEDVVVPVDNGRA